MSMETTCRICRQPFEPTAKAILSGSWRVCTTCQVNSTPSNWSDRETEVVEVGVREELSG